MNKRLNDEILELIILQNGKNYTRIYDKSKFIHEVTNHLKFIKGHSDFLNDSNKKSYIISENELKVHYLIMKLKEPLSIMFNGIKPDSEYSLTDIVCRCIKVLSKQMYYLNNECEDTNEMIQLPNGIKEISNIEYIKSTIFGQKTKSNYFTELNVLNLNNPKSLPLVFSRFKNFNDIDWSKVDRILDDKIYNHRINGSKELIKGYLSRTHTRLYNMVGCLSFEECLNQRIEEIGGYFHPLQTRYKIQKPFLNKREQLLLLLIITNTPLIHTIYKSLFENDTKPFEFYYRIIYPVIRGIQFEPIQFEDELSINDMFMISSEHPEISLSEYFEKFSYHNEFSRT